MPLDLASQVKQASTLKELETLFKNEDIRSFWKQMSESEKKAVAVTEALTKKINALVDSLDAASEATQNYFNKIDKYRGTIGAMNTAFKEGQKHMSDYLKEAAQSGGKIAVAGAAIAFMAKTLSDTSDKMVDGVMSFRRYKIEMETFAKTTGYSQKSLEKLRSEVDLTRSGMVDFFDVLERGRSLDMSLDKIKQVYQSLRNVYGLGAKDMMRSYQDILKVLPTLQGTNRAPTSLETMELAASGQFGKVMQLQRAGLFGGTAETSKSAGFETAQEKTNAITERLYDVVHKAVPKQLLVLGKIFGTLLGISQTLAVLAGTGGALRAVGMGANWTGTARGLAAGGAGLALSRSQAIPAMNVPFSTRIKGALPKLGRGMLNTLKSPKGAGIGALALGLGSSMAADTLAERGHTKSAAGVGIAGNVGSMALTGLAIGGPWGAAIGGVIGLAMSYKQIGELFKSDASKNKDKMDDLEARLQDFTGKEWIQPFYDSIMNIVSRATQFISDMQAGAEASMAVSGMGGNVSGIISGGNTAISKSTEKFQTTMSLLSQQRDKLLKGQMEARAKFEKENPSQKWEGSQSEKIFKDMEAKIASEEAMATKAYAEDKIRMVTDINNALIEQGRKGLAISLGIIGERIAASKGIEVSRLSGGESAAFTRARRAAISEAQDRLGGYQTAITAQKQRVAGATTDIERNNALKELNRLEQEQVGVLNELNNAILDMSDIEQVRKEVEIFSSVLQSQLGYVKDLNGSYVAMRPLWEEELNVKKRQAQLAQAELARLDQDPRVNKTSLEYKQKEANFAMLSLEAKKEEFELAKKTRDQKKEEIDFAAGWTNELADYIDEMGGSFRDVLSLRSAALAKEREAIAVQQEFINTGVQNGTLSGFELIKAQTDLERMKMKVTKDTIGIQKSAYEKFVGMAFGALGDIGFKKGRMDDAVLMGVEATRVKNRAGLYERGAPNMTRDQLSAVMATGTALKGLNVTSDLKKIDSFKKSRMATKEEKPEMKVDGKVQIELSPELIMKTQDWSFRLSSNKDFGNALIAANQLVTQNMRAKGTGG